ncbi:MAG: hypothetical protein N2Z20_03405 [Elusimicrobiales bacterium]|nr:hypothetical protein [Elusimicrobiales bacterium]
MSGKHAFIITVSVAILLFSVKKIYNKINLYLYQTHAPNRVENQSIMINEMNQQQQLENSSKDNNSTQNLDNFQKETNREQNDTSLTSQQNQQNFYRIILRYENKKAKKVKLSGSFYAWKERDMKKADFGIWEEELVIKDRGIYKYYFIVDGKRILDPKAKKSNDGKYSIFEIK